MLVRVISVTSLSLLAFATVARAADDASAKVGFEYHASLKHDDHGLTERSGGADPVKTTNIMLNNAKLNVEGVATKDVDYRFRYNMTGNSLELGYANLKLNPMINFLIGRYKVREGGFEVRDYGYDTIASSDYLAALPFSIYSDMVQVQLNMDFGTISLQLLDDRLPAAGATAAAAATMYNTSSKQPAWIVEWLGSFGDWSPLVQLGSYDLNHSKYFVVGVNGKVSGLGLSLDYVSDQRAIKAGDKTLTDTHSNINFGASYALAGWTPWLKFSKYDVSESTDSALRPKETEGNDGSTVGAEDFEDNGQMIQVGVNCDAFKAAYVPYAAIVSHSGTFLGTDATDASKTATLSNMTLQVGVHGKF